MKTPENSSICLEFRKQILFSISYKIIKILQDIMVKIATTIM